MCPPSDPCDAGVVSSERIDLGMSTGDRAVVLVGFPLAGAGLGALLPLVWGVVEDASWIPFHGPLAALMSVDDGWSWLVRIGGLALVGLVVAVVAIAEDTVVSIGQDDVRIRVKGTSRTIGRERIAGVFHDGKHLVIETAEGRRLLDAEVDGAKRKAAPAFQQFGYPWEND